MAKMSPRVAERRSMAGKNKTARQAETSMSKKYKGTPKVSQRTIDKIKGMGMSAALKSAATNKNPEFREGLRRMYGAARVNKAISSPAKKAAAPAQKQSLRVAERTMQKKSPRVMERSAAKKTAASAPKSDLMSRRKAQAERARARFKKPGLPRLAMGVKQYK